MADKKFKDEDFIEALTNEPQTTSQIRTKLLQKYEKISQDWVLKTLIRLYEKGIEKDGETIYPVERSEIQAASNIGKMYLWKKKEE